MRSKPEIDHKITKSKSYDGPTVLGEQCWVLVKSMSYGGPTPWGEKVGFRVG